MQNLLLPIHFFFRTCAIVLNDVYDGIVGHLGVSIAFGFVVLEVIYVIGEISGAHLNPAVSWSHDIGRGLALRKSLANLCSGIHFNFYLNVLIINVATSSKEQGVSAGLAIELTVLIYALVGGLISGASMNPVRSIGTA